LLKYSWCSYPTPVIELQIVEGNGYQLTDEEIGEVIAEAFTSARPRSNSSRSDSDKTIRGRDRKPTTESAKSSPTSHVEEPHDVTGSSVADEPTTVSIMDSSTGSPSLSVHPAQSQNPVAGEGPWQIHHSKLPGSSEVAFGPISTNRLVKRLEGKQELVGSFIVPLFREN